MENKDYTLARAARNNSLLTASCAPPHTNAAHKEKET